MRTQTAPKESIFIKAEPEVQCERKAFGLRILVLKSKRTGLYGFRVNLGSKVIVESEYFFDSFKALEEGLSAAKELVIEDAEGIVGYRLS